MRKRLLSGNGCVQSTASSYAAKQNAVSLPSYNDGCVTIRACGSHPNFLRINRSQDSCAATEALRHLQNTRFVRKCSIHVSHSLHTRKTLTALRDLHPRTRFPGSKLHAVLTPVSCYRKSHSERSLPRIARLLPLLPATIAYFVLLETATKRGHSSVFSHSALPYVLTEPLICSSSPIYAVNLHLGRQYDGETHIRRRPGGLGGLASTGPVACGTGFQVTEGGHRDRVSDEAGHLGKKQGACTGEGSLLSH